MSQKPNPRTSKSHPINVSWLFPATLIPQSHNVDLLDYLGVPVSQYPNGRAPSNSGYVGKFPVGKISTSVPSISAMLKADCQVKSTVVVEGEVESTRGREEIEVMEANSTSNSLVQSAAQSMEVLASPMKNCEGVSFSNGGFVPVPFGNFALSSCPGKKVSYFTVASINRDLDSDFARLREMGIHTIVCCLNDPELRYLGAPWDKYKESADKIAMRIIRIPMVEGSCPETTEEMDNALSIVEEILRRGENVLCHCRGG